MYVGFACSHNLHDIFFSTYKSHFKEHIMPFPPSLSLPLLLPCEPECERFHARCTYIHTYIHTQAKTDFLQKHHTYIHTYIHAQVERSIAKRIIKGAADLLQKQAEEQERAARCAYNVDQEPEMAADMESIVDDTFSVLDI
jgi:hypothetical protein